MHQLPDCHGNKSFSKHCIKRKHKICVCMCAYLVYVTYFSANEANSCYHIPFEIGIQWLFTYSGLQSVTLVLIPITVSVWKRARRSDLVRQRLCGWGAAWVSLLRRQNVKQIYTKREKRISVLQDKCWLSPKCRSNDSTIKMQKWASRKNMQQFTTANRLERKPPQS